MGIALEVAQLREEMIGIDFDDCLRTSFLVIL